jgi:hypothetical protein
MRVLMRVAGVSLLLALVTVGCGTPPSNNFDHVFRAVDSPDGTATAHIARNASGGAAGSLVYDVYLSKYGSVENPELVFHGYSDCNLEVEWRSRHLLVIRYAGWSCTVYTFHNFWNERELERTERNVPRVEIMLERVPPAADDVWHPR